MSKKVFEFAGEKIDVYWDRRLCIHVGECTRAEGELFVAGRKPWCQPDLASGAEVAEVVERCPSGALSYVYKSAAPAERPASGNTVTVVNNGPLYLRGEIAIEGAPADAPGLAFRAALCRCGGSSNKPFCDGSHDKIAFRDAGAVGKKPDTAGDKRGRLEIRPAQNGPLLLSGPFSIMAASGRMAWCGDKAALCRCGQSTNKPFCDGSHKKAGFEAD